ncbi:FHA domain-containing protein [Duganella violaceipulchra]|uniref:Type III secretion protein D n=1 Tax=Duganella violaceipulchra TaxID=2849652 RepID=A0AA41H8A9_9BURK|nr:FHA domain-containing protein [Duganella violaceicalia]MBV6322485.1 hypothetical protein [Duganella violaceicalia]MCP2010692.1 type III secretion protein D [Duganella violaceicalia]
MSTAYPTLGPDGLELRVLTGLHAGAALPLDSQAVLLGSDEACDVILLDPDILPRHMRLLPSDGHWLLESATPAYDRLGQEVAGGAPMLAGEPLRVGGTWVALFARAAPWDDSAVPAWAEAATPAAPRLRRRWPPALFALSALLALLAAGAGLLSWSVRAPVTSACAAEPAPIVGADAPVADAEGVRKEAVRVLGERALLDLVSIVYDAEHLSLEAQLDEAETRRFDGALAALHRSLGSAVAIDVKLVPMAVTPPFEVREIVSGPGAHVTLANGQVIYEGGSAGGYRLLAIHPGKLLFSGRRQIELPW